MKKIIEKLWIDPKKVLSKESPKIEGDGMLKKVQEIHNDFFGLEEKYINQSKKELLNINKSHDKADRLKVLGFTSTEIVKNSIKEKK